MSLSQAVVIAAVSGWLAEGELEETSVCNQNTGTWWIDLDINAPGCSPACVVDVNRGTADINWRCTGLVPPEPSD